MKDRNRNCKSCVLKASNALDCEIYSISAKNDVAIGRACEYFKGIEKEKDEETKEGGE